MNRMVLSDLQCLYNRILVCEDVIHYNGTLLIDLAAHKQLEALKDSILTFKLYCEGEFAKSMPKSPEDLANMALSNNEASPLPFPRTLEAFKASVTLATELREKYLRDNQPLLDLPSLANTPLANELLLDESQLSNRDYL